MIQPSLSGFARLFAWTVTMGNDRLVVQQTAVVDEDHPRVEGRTVYTIFVAPDLMGQLHGSRLWVDGKLIDTKPTVDVEPVGSTYDLIIGRVLWPLGRGFCRRIDRLNEVIPQPNDTLLVKAEATRYGTMMRWELVVDPHEDFLVRSAKWYRGDDTMPSYTIETLGTLIA